jgi:hypothetical protein
LGTVERYGNEDKSVSFMFMGHMSSFRISSEKLKQAAKPTVIQRMERTSLFLSSSR